MAKYQDYRYYDYMAQVVWLNQLHKLSTKQIGQQAHKIGLLSHHGISVPQAFCLPSSFTHEFFNHKDLIGEIDSLLSELNLLKVDDMEKTAAAVAHAISHHPFPERMAMQIAKAYNKLDQRDYVELSLSASPEVLPERLLEYFDLHPIRVKGDANLLSGLKELWKLLFSAQALAFRHRHNIDHRHLDVAILVSHLPRGEVSGTASTIDELAGSKSLINIEAVWGIYDDLLTGQAEADFYQVEKTTWRIDQCHISRQPFARPINNLNTRRRLFWGKPNRQKLTDAQIVDLAQKVNQLPKVLFFPQRVQWILTKSGICFTRIRQLEEPDTYQTKSDQAVLGANKVAQGFGVSPGVVEGTVVKHNHKRKSRYLRGQIVVLERLTDEVFDLVSGASGVIAIHGNYSAHTGVLLRERGIPVVADVYHADEQLQSGEHIVINGLTGEVLKGLAGYNQEKPHHTQNVPRTVTKTLMSLDSLGRSADVSAEVVDGVVILAESYKDQEGILMLLEHLGHRRLYLYLPRSMNQLDLAAQAISSLLKSNKLTHDQQLQLVVPGPLQPEIVKQYLVAIKGHTSKLNLFLELTSPLCIYQLGQLKTKEFNGVVVDLDSVALHLLGGGHRVINYDEKIQAKSVLAALGDLFAKLKGTTSEVFVMESQILLKQPLLHLMIDHGISAVVASPTRLELLRSQLSQAEHWHLGKQTGAEQ